MKLIINIPDVAYEFAKQRWMRAGIVNQTDYYISKGIPLDYLRSDIELLKADGLANMDAALSVIDRYYKESEVRK